MQENIADLIIDKIWVGNYYASKDVSFIANNHIQVIVNCTKDLINLFDSVIEYYRVPIDDNLQIEEIKNMYYNLPDVVEYIYKKVVLENKNVLIHCAAGRQRSACVVVAYLVGISSIPLNECIDYVKTRRPSAFFLNINFYESLKQFCLNINKKIN